MTERELLGVFLETYGNKYYYMAREIIWLNSIKADAIIGENGLLYMSDKERLQVKRNLTHCLSVISFGTKFNADFVSSLSRSKTFAEFTVSTTRKNDPSFITRLLDEAAECVAEVEDMVGFNKGLKVTPQSFVKSGCNPASRRSDRLWHHYDLNPRSTQTYASEKRWVNGRRYKDGGNY